MQSLFFICCVDKDLSSHFPVVWRTLLSCVIHERCYLYSVFLSLSLSSVHLLCRRKILLFFWWWCGPSYFSCFQCRAFSVISVSDWCLIVCLFLFSYVTWSFSTVRDRVRSKKERDILADVNHPFIVKLNYGKFLMEKVSWFTSWQRQKKGRRCEGIMTIKCQKHRDCKRRVQVSKYFNTRPFRDMADGKTRENLKNFFKTVGSPDTGVVDKEDEWVMTWIILSFLYSKRNFMTLVKVKFMTIILSFRSFCSWHMLLNNDSRMINMVQPDYLKKYCHHCLGCLLVTCDVDTEQHSRQKENCIWCLIISEEEICLQGLTKR